MDTLKRLMTTQTREALDVLLESLKNIFYDPAVQALFKWLCNEQIEAFWETFYEKVNNIRNQWDEKTQNDEINQRFNKFLMKFSCWIDTFYYKEF